jgi:hypothetical protein
VASLMPQYACAISPATMMIRILNIASAFFLSR